MDNSVNLRSLLAGRKRVRENALPSAVKAHEDDDQDHDILMFRPNPATTSSSSSLSRPRPQSSTFGKPRDNTQRQISTADFSSVDCYLPKPQRRTVRELERDAKLQQIRQHHPHLGGAQSSTLASSTVAVRSKNNSVVTDGKSSLKKTRVNEVVEHVLDEEHQHDADQDFLFSLGALAPPAVLTNSEGDLLLGEDEDDAFVDGTEDVEPVGDHEVAQPPILQVPDEHLLQAATTTVNDDVVPPHFLRTKSRSMSKRRVQIASAINQRNALMEVHWYGGEGSLPRFPKGNGLAGRGAGRGRGRGGRHPTHPSSHRPHHGGRQQ